MEAIAIKEVLQEIFQGLEGERKKREQALLSAWEKAVGPKGLNHTKVLAVKNRTLIVGVDSSPWLYLLSLYKQRILKKITEELEDFPAEKIEQIRFKTGKI